MWSLNKALAPTFIVSLHLLVPPSGALLRIDNLIMESVTLKDVNLEICNADDAFFDSQNIPCHLARGQKSSCKEFSEDFFDEGRISEALMNP